MMKNYLRTYLLIILFFTGLIVYWGLEHAGVRTENERRLRETRFLPALLDVPELGIRKLAIERPGERLVFERRARGRDGGRWSSRKTWRRSRPDWKP